MGVGGDRAAVRAARNRPTVPARDPACVGGGGGGGVGGVGGDRAAVRAARNRPTVPARDPAYVGGGVVGGVGGDRAAVRAVRNRPTVPARDPAYVGGGVDRAAVRAIFDPPVVIGNNPSRIYTRLYRRFLRRQVPDNGVRIRHPEYPGKPPLLRIESVNRLPGAVKNPVEHRRGILPDRRPVHGTGFSRIVLEPDVVCKDRVDR